MQLFLPNHQLSSKQKIINFLPLVVLELYLIVTLVLYQYGPYPWPTMKPVLFWSLIFIYHVAFIVGYCLCMKTQYVSRDVDNLNRYMTIVVKLFLIVNIFIILLNITRDYRFDHISIVDIVERFFQSVKNPEVGYSIKVDEINTAVYGGKLLTLFFLSTLIIPAFAIPMGIIYFDKLNIWFKMLLALNLVLEIMHWVGIGTNKGIFDLAVTVVVIVGIKLLRYLYYKDFKKKKLLIMFLVVVGGLSCFLLFFNKSIGGRLQGDAWLQYSVGGILPNTNCEIFRFLPHSLFKPIALLTMYLTQGYYAMSMALTLDWIPMFGLGGEMFLQDYIDKYIYNIGQYTYAERLWEFGWHPRVNWHSLYLWIANDLSFYGVIIFMIVFGYCFAYFYRNSLLSGNSLCIVIFISLCIMALFIPANNQVFGFIYPCVKFIFTIALYIIFCKTQRVRK